jgi:transposase
MGMEREQTTLSEQTRTLLAEQGIEVTEEGVARARQKLHEAEQRMTPEARARIDRIFRLDQSAA